MDIKTFWKQYGQHIEALAIILLLVLVWFTYASNNKLQKEINVNCGWGDETYRCVCGKGIVEQLELKMNQTNLNTFGDFYVELDK
jgi:hypothetical protein